MKFPQDKVRLYKSENLRGLVAQLQKNQWDILTRGFQAIIVVKKKPEIEKKDVVIIFKRRKRKKAPANNPTYGLSKYQKYCYWLMKEVLGLDCRIL